MRTLSEWQRYSPYSRWSVVQLTEYYLRAIYPAAAKTEPLLIEESMMGRSILVFLRGCPSVTIPLEFLEDGVLSKQELLDTVILPQLVPYGI